MAFGRVLRTGLSSLRDRAANLRCRLAASRFNPSRWWPVSRARLETSERRERELRYRLFVLRDNMKEAKRRAGFNIRIPDNAACYRVLDIALIRDLEAETR